MSLTDHHISGRSIIANIAIITISDTRNEATDTSGQMIRRLLEEAHHKITTHHIVKDEPAQIQSLILALLKTVPVDCILTNGGTGISPRDQTITAIEGIIDIPLPGFGELFRMLSHPVAYWWGRWHG